MGYEQKRIFTNIHTHDMYIENFAGHLVPDQKHFENCYFFFYNLAPFRKKNVFYKEIKSTYNIFVFIALGSHQNLLLKPKYYHHTSCFFQWYAEKILLFWSKHGNHG